MSPRAGRAARAVLGMELSPNTGMRHRETQAASNCQRHLFEWVEGVDLES